MTWAIAVGGDVSTIVGDDAVQALTRKRNPPPKQH